MCGFRPERLTGCQTDSSVGHKGVQGFARGRGPFPKGRCQTELKHGQRVRNRQEKFGQWPREPTKSLCTAKLPVGDSQLRTYISLVLCTVQLGYAKRLLDNCTNMHVAASAPVHQCLGRSG